MTHSQAPPSATAEQIDAMGDEIAELSARISAANQRLLECLRRFDEVGGWGAQGATSLSHWLNWRTGLSMGAAREKVRVARALGKLPLVNEALKKGLISYSKARAVTRVATPDNEETLVVLARQATAAQLERMCSGYKRCVTPPSEREYYVHRFETEDGDIRVDALLPAEKAAVLFKALDVARMDARSPHKARGDVSAETSTESIGQARSDAGYAGDVSAETKGRFTRVDALAGIAETYLSLKERPSTVPGRYEVIVHVDAATLSEDGAGETFTRCELDDGMPLAPETARRLACDAPWVRVLKGAAGETLDVGRRTRAAPAPLRRALWLRDRGCCFPGCTNRVFVDAHHIKPWAKGGETKLSNLVSICRFHHTLLHEKGFSLAADAEGRWVFRDPQGRVIPQAPQLPILEGDPVATLAEEQRRAGVHVGPHTATPLDGGTVDFDMAICGIAEGGPVGDADPLGDPMWPEPGKGDPATEPPESGNADGGERAA